MKKLLTIITALTLVFAVAGCKDKTPAGLSDAELVAEATTALLLTDLNGVTGNLSLPATGLHDSTITWSSANTDVISDAGVVTRPAIGTADAVVVITATVTVGDESLTKNFSVKVLVDVPKLDVTIAEINEVTMYGADLFISEYIEGSSNNKAIEIYNSTDATIDLTDYSVTGYTGKLDDNNVIDPTKIYTYDLTGTLAAGEVLVICTDQVTADNLLDTNCDVELAYASPVHFGGDDTVELYKGDVLIDIIFDRESANDGSDDLKNVTLVRKDDVKGAQKNLAGIVEYDDSEWKEYPVDTFDYIGSHEVRPTGVIPEGKVVEVTGVVYSIITGNGVQIFDETGFVTIYTAYSAFSTVVYEIGDEVKFIGEKDDYFGLAQVKNITDAEVLTQDNTLPTYTEATIIGLYAEDPFDTVYNAKPITVTGMVTVRDIDNGENAVVSVTDANHKEYKVVVYYKSDTNKLADLKALAGKMVTVDLIGYGYKDTIPSWRAIISSEATMTSRDLTPAEVASYEMSQIDLGNLDEVTLDLVLNTSGMINGTTISWASDNPTVVSTAGVVTRAPGDTTVVLTATVKVGTTEISKDFTLTVIDSGTVEVAMSVADFLALDPETDTDPVLLKGIITAMIGDNNIILQDATGGPGVVLYKYGVNTEATHTLGDEITVTGIRDEWYGLEEMSDLETITILSSGNTVQSASLTVDTIVADLAAQPYLLQATNATLTNLQVTSITTSVGGNSYIEVADQGGDLSKTIMFDVRDIPYSSEYVVGDIISELTVVVWDVYYDVNERVVVTAHPAARE